MKTCGLFVLNLAWILLTLVSGVTHAWADESPIRVYGSTTFAELIQGLEKDFVKEHPDARVKVLGRTSAFGFQALLNRECDIVMAARKPTDVERRLAERKHLQWAGVRVAWGNVAVISHPGASVSELTVDQLRKIYTGEYNNWKELGGADLPIVLHSMRYPQEDIAVWFADNVLAKADFAPGMIWINAPDYLVRHVSVHTGSVGYLGNLRLVDVLKRRPQLKVRVLSVRQNAELPAFSPSEDLSKKGDYPLTVPLFLFWNENDPNKRIEQFAWFCKERFQEPIER